MLTLRPYQQEGVEELRAGYRQKLRAGVYCLPTGGGKTPTACGIISGAIERERKTCFIVHRRELRKQACQKLDMFDIPYGVIAPGFPRTDRMVQVASKDTLIHRLDKYDFDFLIFDECHHCLAQTWQKIVAHYSKAKILGLTATPCRMSGEGLGAVFDFMVVGPSVRDLIDQCALSKYTILVPPIPLDLTGVHVRGGDYKREELELATDRRAITGDAIEHYRRDLDGKATLVFCVSVAHAEHTAQAYREAGIRAESVDGSMDEAVRDDRIAAIGDGRLDCLMSCDLIGEGLDVPGVVGVQDLKKSLSLSAVLQRWGRSLRPAPGKDCAVILDHVGNALTHGLPDTPREWSLEHGVVRRTTKTVDAVEVRACSQCYAVHEWALECPYCGFVYPIKERKGPTVEKGELRELTADEIAALELRAAKTGRLQDMHNAAKAKAVRDGVAYKPGPVWIKWKYGRRHAATAAKG